MLLNKYILYVIFIKLLILKDVSRTVSGIRTIFGNPLKTTKQLGEHSQSLAASDSGETGRYYF